MSSFADIGNRGRPAVGTSNVVTKTGAVELKGLRRIRKEEAIENQGNRTGRDKVTRTNSTNRQEGLVMLEMNSGRRSRRTKKARDRLINNEIRIRKRGRVHDKKKVDKKPATNLFYTRPFLFLPKPRCCAPRLYLSRQIA